MKIGSKYKIAKRLGAQVFDKTQTQKFMLSQARSEANKKRGRGGSRSDYAKQFLEKQKVRYTYGLTERQFRNYIRATVNKKGQDQAAYLFSLLEGRLDNLVYRLGLAPSRRAGRQMVSHGHFLVEGKKVKVPSYQISMGEAFGIREGSKESPLFLNLPERLKDIKPPSWVAFDPEKGEGKVLALPRGELGLLPFNLSAVLEFYTR